MFKNNLKLKSNKKGFTVIELLATLIVLGTFIIIATPKLLGFVQVAEEIRIQNDVRVAENLSVLEIYRNGFDLANGKNVEVANQEQVSVDIQEAIENGKAYNIKGKISQDNKLDENTYYELDETFIKDDVRTNLNGKFYSTNDARVIYIENESDNRSLTTKAADIAEMVKNKFKGTEEIEEMNLADMNVEEVLENVNIENAEDLLESYTSLLSSIK